jgi:ABC-2 type transport system permease protein
MTPSPLAQVITVTSYEIRKYIRGRRLLGILILVGLILALFIGLPPALGSPYASTPNAFVSGFATFTGLLVVLSGVLFAADALVSEHEKRTGYFLFPNPVRREVLVLGKIAASLIVSAAVISLYYGGAALAALVITHSLTWDVGLSYVYALAYMVAVVGVAYLISAMFKSTVAATVLTFFLFTLIFSIVGAILPAAKIDPWFIPTSASGIISNVLGGASVRPGPGGDVTVRFVPDPATSLLVFAAYAIVAGALAVLWFRRRELSS